MKERTVQLSQPSGESSARHRDQDEWNEPKPQLPVGLYGAEGPTQERLALKKCRTRPVRFQGECFTSFFSESNSPDVKPNTNFQAFPTFAWRVMLVLPLNEAKSWAKFRASNWESNSLLSQVRALPFEEKIGVASPFSIFQFTRSGPDLRWSTQGDVGLRSSHQASPT